MSGPSVEKDAGRPFITLHRDDLASIIAKARREGADAVVAAVEARAVGMLRLGSDASKIVHEARAAASEFAETRALPPGGQHG